MKIIEQSHEFLDRSDPLRLIEVAGRTCYKSEDKITDDSAMKFVTMLLEKGHTAMIEHASECMYVDDIIYEDVLKCEDRPFINIEDDGKCKIISGNLWALKAFCREYAVNRPKIIVSAYNMMYYLACRFPWLYPESEDWNRVGVVNPWYPKQLEMLIPLYGFIRHASEDGRSPKHVWRTVKFVTNRGVTHELVRHRPVSYAQESTRYVNYGGQDMAFVQPIWAPNLDQIANGVSNEDESAYANFYASCFSSAKQYKKLIDLHWPPQYAREVLPNALKTEIVVSANLPEWKHIFKMRCSKAAHPQIRELMMPVRDAFIEEFPDFFS